MWRLSSSEQGTLEEAITAAEWSRWETAIGVRMEGGIREGREGGESGGGS